VPPLGPPWARPGASQSTPKKGLQSQKVAGLGQKELIFQFRNPTFGEKPYSLVGRTSKNLPLQNTYPLLWCLPLLFVFLAAPTFAQSDSLKPGPVDSLSQPFIRKSSLIALPIAFYTPETRFGAGAAGLFAFRFRGEPDTSRPSQIQLGFAYTQERQVLLYFPFQLFIDEARINTYGELGYYRYFFPFFGLGNETLQEEREIYEARFPRIRLTLLHRLRPNLYGGLRYWFDDYRITETLEGGILDRSDFTGRSGGRTGGGGPVLIWDSRDQIFYPTRGQLVEVVALFNRPFLGSDYSYQRFSVDAATYHTSRWGHTLATNAVFTTMSGDPPFQDLALLGGTKKMRGYIEGRFRDRALWLLQAEYRAPLFWRLGAVAFGSVGSVGPTVSELGQPHFAYGLGIRFLLSKADHVNVRLDIAADEQFNLLPYLTVGEAF
jgi:hypothetical protein